MHDIQHIAGVSCTVGESPLWHEANQAWYWSDIPARRIWRLDGASGALRHWDTAEMVACFAPRANGGWIAGMETGIFHLELKADGSVAAGRLAAPASLGAGMRFNDGRCDRQGRFWSGTMFMDMSAARAIGELYRYDANGLSAPAVSGLLTQNGLAWSPDGRTMYLSDSHPKSRTVWAFDYDTDSGTPSRRRVFADMANFAGRPDGAAIDTDGCYWIAGNDGSCLLRFTPDGALDREIALPVAKPAMCSFGGPGMEWMLVTSIRPGDAPADSPAGGVFLLRPGVRGVADTPFAG